MTREEIDFDPVTAVRPLAPYVGGKRNLARQLIARIQETPHQIYAEAFVGMGGVFLRRPSRPKAEVINDISGDVATLFRVLQEHYPYFLDMLRWRLTSRAEFERLAGQDPSRLTDLQRAARFLYLQRTAFGGRVAGRGYGVDPNAPARFNVTKLEPMLADLHERLAGVAIEQLHFAEFIPRYDRPGTLFYLDPPYWGCEGDYGVNAFSPADFELLRGLLERLRGRFILSINDRPEIRAIFRRFAIEQVDVNYRVSGGVTPARELIITGP